MTKKDYTDRIVKDPAIMVGKPVVKGTRIPVEKVLAYMAENPDLKELFEAYPELTEEDVKACLDYARSAVVSESKLGDSPNSSVKHPAHL